MIPGKTLAAAASRAAIGLAFNPPSRNGMLAASRQQSPILIFIRFPGINALSEYQILSGNKEAGLATAISLPPNPP